MAIDLNFLLNHRLLGIDKIDCSWFFNLDDNITIGTEAQWRLIGSSRIQITSEDDNQKYGLPEPIDAAKKALSLLISKSVLKVTIVR